MSYDIFELHCRNLLKYHPLRGEGGRSYEFRDEYGTWFVTISLHLETEWYRLTLAANLLKASGEMQAFDAYDYMDIKKWPFYYAQRPRKCSRTCPART